MVAELKRRGAPAHSRKYNNCNSNRIPNYYNMSGEPASAPAQRSTGADKGPTTAETVGATTTGTGTTQEQDNDVQRLDGYKLPQPFFTGDYSQCGERLF